jgi:hypothetical protein
MSTLRIACVAMIAAALALPLGCAGPKQAYRPAEPLHLEGVSRAEAMQAAEDTLSKMHFVIEKLDAEQGIIRTEPLRGAQFFEFWRRDNVGLHSTAEANLHTIRRAVELQIVEQQGRVFVDCRVQVQRLSLPENKAAGVSQAYRMHSASMSRIQRLQLTPQQRQGMAWIDMGRDDGLAARILDAITNRVRQLEEGKGT